MSRRRSAATAAEQAELRDLSTQTAQTRRQVGDTVEALAGKIAAETDIPALARRGAAHVAADARQAAGSAARMPVSATRKACARGGRWLRYSGYLRVAAFGGPAVILTAVVAWQVLRRAGRAR